MSKVQVTKVEEKYRLETTYNEKPLSITMTVHLDNQERTISLVGKHDKFEFRSSDPYLVAALNVLIAEAVEVAQRAFRVSRGAKEVA